MSMTVQDLRDALEGLDPDMPVRIASQPSWPFEYEIADAVVSNPRDEQDEESIEVGGRFPIDDDTFYLVEGRQIGYLPGMVRDAVGWSRR